ncbi:plant cysteine oxidase 1-like isoform X2 [Wolffia australiana]
MKLADCSSLRRNQICRGDFGDVERVITKRKAAGEGICRRRARRRVAASSSAIQTLFLACKSIFSGPPTVPSPADVRMIRNIVDMMTSEDVDLSPEIPFFKAKTAVGGAPGVSYTTIYQSSNFSICIFFLRPAAVIPLHDHPGMTVFSKLLLGSMHVRAYDFVDTLHLTSDAPPQEDGEVGGERKEGKYWWLEETDMPEEAVLAPVTYLGPPVVDV